MKDLKNLLKKNRRILADNDKPERKSVRKKTDRTINVCKNRYKEKEKNLYKSDKKKSVGVTLSN